MGFSSVHFSDVPLILNLRIGYIFPRYHVIFIDDFSTITLISADTDPLSLWNVVDLKENSMCVPLYGNSRVLLEKDWLSSEELEERSYHNIRQAQLCKAITPSTALVPTPLATLTE